MFLYILKSGISKYSKLNIKNRSTHKSLTCFIQNTHFLTHANNSTRVKLADFGFIAKNTGISRISYLIQNI